MYFVNPLTHIIGGKNLYGKCDENISVRPVHPFSDLDSCVKVEYFPDCEVAVAYDGTHLKSDSQVVDVVDINPWVFSDDILDSDISSLDLAHSDLGSPDNTSPNLTHSHISSPDTSSLNITHLHLAHPDVTSSDLSSSENVSVAGSHDTWLSSTCTEATGWSEAPKYYRKPNATMFQPDPAGGKSFEEQMEWLGPLFEAYTERIEAEGLEDSKFRKDRTLSWIQEHVVMLEWPVEEEEEDEVFEDALEYQEGFEVAPEPQEEEKTSIVNSIHIKKALSRVGSALLLWLVLRGVQKEVEGLQDIKLFQNQEHARVEVAVQERQPEVFEQAVAEEKIRAEEAVVPLPYGEADWSKLNRHDYWNCMLGWRNTYVCGYWLGNPRPKAPGGYW